MWPSLLTFLLVPGYQVQSAQGGNWQCHRIQEYYHYHPCPHHPRRVTEFRNIITNILAPITLAESQDSGILLVSSLPSSPWQSHRSQEYNNYSPFPQHHGNVTGFRNISIIIFFLITLTGYRVQEYNHYPHHHENVKVFRKQLLSSFSHHGCWNNGGSRGREQWPRLADSRPRRCAGVTGRVKTGGYGIGVLLHSSLDPPDLCKICTNSRGRGAPTSSEMCQKFLRGDPTYSLHISEEGGGPLKCAKLPSLLKLYTLLYWG